jgi:hypothetical protein
MERGLAFILKRCEFPNAALSVFSVVGGFRLTAMTSNGLAVRIEVDAIREVFHTIAAQGVPDEWRMAFTGEGFFSGQKSIDHFQLQDRTESADLLALCFEDGHRIEGMFRTTNIGVLWGAPTTDGRRMTFSAKSLGPLNMILTPKEA